MQSKKKILIADDEKDILEFLQFTFENAGFEVITAVDGIQALKQAKQIHPDIILLDIMMPNLEGTSVCEQLRRMDEFKNIPIVFLTARTSEESEVNAFEIGADDFIGKPIKPKALLSRINKLLSQKNNSTNFVSNNKITKINEAEIDHETYTLHFRNKAVILARKEFQLIEMLASKPGKVFTRKQIFDKIWGTNLSMGDRTIDVHVRKIRVKTADDFIKTVKGVGFKIEA
jgi:two-component system alkaline phosphatase synthesis response regulator PhoP